ncbi:MAG: hypothetical protein LBH68_01530 [Bifidobacteriaceae bacterium]|jgi:hypothetical protein|nr:hypothetical protein [Bifidobacteriaceae bacterium]
MRKTTKVILWHTLMAGAGAGALAAWRWQLRWGATAAEQRAVLPGDELVPQPMLQATRAIGINAPPSSVWPWLVQLGQDKGGFYSYDWLERAAGLGIYSAEAIEPDWQNLKVGEPVRLAQGMELSAAIVEVDKALVLSNLDAVWDEPGMPPDFDFSWAFVLEPEGPTGTRLVVRERYSTTRWRTGLLVKAVAWVSFLMSRAMLVGIKERAEVTWLSEMAKDFESDAAGPEDPAG